MTDISLSGFAGPSPLRRSRSRQVDSASARYAGIAVVAIAHIGAVYAFVDLLGTRAIETIAYDALRRVQHAAPDRQGALVVTVHSAVADFLRGEGAPHVAALAARLGRPVRVEAEATFARDEIAVAAD